MKKILLALVFCLALGSTSLFAQSKTAEKFEKSSEGYKLFLYQSMIRMLNKDQNPEFNMLIKDLDHLRVVTTKEGAENEADVFADLDSGVQSEGFEALMSFDQKDYKCHLYEKEGRKGKTTWIATFMADGRSGIMEMKGMLNLKYINAFSSLDLDKIEELAPKL